MRHALLAIALFASLSTAGCLGSVTPAEIPASSLDEHGWEQTREDRSDIAGGLGERVLFSYEPSGDAPAGVSTISANDVPVFDESSLLPALIERVEKSRDVEFEETGERGITLENLDANVTATVYDVQGLPAEAQALVFTPPCSSFAAVLAYGTTETGSDGGFFGSGGSDDGSMFEQAVDVSKDVTC